MEGAFSGAELKFMRATQAGFKGFSFSAQKLNNSAGRQVDPGRSMCATPLSGCGRGGGGGNPQMCKLNIEKYLLIVRSKRTFYCIQGALKAEAKGKAPKSRLASGKGELDSELEFESRLPNRSNAPEAPMLKGNAHTCSCHRNKELPKNKDIRARTTD